MLANAPMPASATAMRTMKCWRQGGST
jgi:hypothetical protein